MRSRLYCGRCWPPKCEYLLMWAFIVCSRARCILASDEGVVVRAWPAYCRPGVWKAEARATLFHSSACIYAHALLQWQRWRRLPPALYRALSTMTHILIVEDESEIAGYLRRGLAFEGYSAEIAANGLTARIRAAPCGSCPRGNRLRRAAAHSCRFSDRRIRSSRRACRPCPDRGNRRARVA